MIEITKLIEENKDLESKRDENANILSDALARDISEHIKMCYGTPEKPIRAHMQTKYQSYHIPLSIEDAEAIRDYLNDILGEPDEQRNK